MAATSMIGAGIFEDLQRKIDEDKAVKDVSDMMKSFHTRIRIHQY